MLTNEGETLVVLHIRFIPKIIIEVGGSYNLNDLWFRALQGNVLVVASMKKILVGPESP